MKKIYVFALLFMCFKINCGLHSPLEEQQLENINKAKERLDRFVFFEKGDYLAKINSDGGIVLAGKIMSDELSYVEGNKPNFFLFFLIRHPDNKKDNFRKSDLYIEMAGIIKQVLPRSSLLSEEKQNKIDQSRYYKPIKLVGEKFEQFLNSDLPYLVEIDFKNIKDLMPKNIDSDVFKFMKTYDDIDFLKKSIESSKKEEIEREKEEEERIFYENSRKFWGNNDFHSSDCEE